MGYTNVFGGELIFPSQTSYLEITTAIDVQLVWPREQQIEGNDVVADFLDINASVLGLNIDMPDARSVSTGNKTTISAIGDDFTLRDATGGVIQFATNGTQWVIVLTDNSTEAGIWSGFQLGAATTLASAAALAGSGLQAAAFGLLEQIIDSDEEAATPFDVVDGDRAKCLIYTAGAGTANLPSAGTVFNNWFCMIRNSGSGTLNVLPPSGQIDGGASINLDPNDSAFFFTDGTDYYTIGLSSGSTIAFDFVSLAVPGSGDFVLSGANLDRISYRFTGALTGNRRIVVPNTTQQYWADNQTSGAFSLEVVTAAGAGITIPQGQSVIVYCDGTDVINATSSTSVAFPITIGQGGTSATTASGARTNLNAAFDGILIETQALSGLAGGGDLTANMQLLLDVDNLTAETVIDTAADFVGIWDADAGAMRKFLIEDVVPSPDSLVDSGGNIAVFAAGSSNVQLRSVGDSDSVPRRLQFTWQDETVVGYIGWNSFSQEMFITNSINHADGTIEIFTNHASAEILIGNRLRILSGLQVRGSANNNASIQLTTTAYANRASIGYGGSDELIFENLAQQTITFQGEDSITATVSMLEMNPNTGCHLFWKGDGEIARSASLANGGFEVNNTLTGGGFERVLTVSDSPSVVQAVKTANENVVASTTYQNDNHLINIVLAVGRWGLSGFFQYGVTNASAGFKFRWTDTGGSFAGAPYTFTYRANTGTSPSNADTYFTTLDGSTGALITSLNTGEGVGWLNGNCEIITSPITLTTQWAQVVATGTTSFAENSWLRFTRTDT
jgi:hypothetical protein